MSAEMFPSAVTAPKGETVEEFRKNRPSLKELGITPHDPFSGHRGSKDRNDQFLNWHLFDRPVLPAPEQKRLDQ